jgi:hypothetical protein
VPPPIRRTRRKRTWSPSPAEPIATRTGCFDLQFLLALAAGIAFAAAIVASFDYREDSRLVPLLAAVPGLICAIILLVPHLRNRMLIGLFIATIAAIPLVGFYPAVAAFVLVLLAPRTSLRWMLVPYTAALIAATWGLSKILNLSLPWLVARNRLRVLRKPRERLNRCARATLTLPGTAR